MNKGKVAIASIVLFIFFAVFDYFFHGKFLHELYLQTANMWRLEEAMQDYFIWISASQISVAILIVILYNYAFNERNVGNGMVYGLLLGLMGAAGYLVSYAVAPYPMELIIKWMAGVTIECLIAGLLVGLICKTN